MYNTLTYTDIANMAIDWCGGPLSISDINDKNNPDAIVCARNLPQAIRSEFEKYEWAIAQRIAVAIEEQNPKYAIDGYFCYVLPDDFLRLSLYLLEQYIPPAARSEYVLGHSFMIRQNKLYTKFPIKKFPYITHEVDISEWPALFADCVALNLAERICGKIKGLDADISFYENLYKVKLKDARRLELIQTEASQGGMSVLQYNRIVP